MLKATPSHYVVPQRRLELAEKLRACAALFSAFFAGSLLLGVSGCSGQGDTGNSEYVTRVASLKGPTSIGLLNMMEKAKNNEFPEKYDFSVEATADVISQKILQNEIDVALIPANMASILYNKTNGEVRVLDVCANSVLDIVAQKGTVSSFTDVADKTIYTMGKGTSPEYVLNYLLQQAGLTNAVHVEFKQEAAEVIQALVDDPAAIAVLPQPFATVAPTKVSGFEIAMDLERAWEEYAPEGSRLVCGVTVLRQQYLEEHERLAEEFVRHQDDSVKKALNQIGDTAKLVVKYGIVENEEIAKKAIPYCGLSCTRNEDMRRAVNGYLTVLSSMDAASIGGSVPDEHFYISETF